MEQLCIVLILKFEPFFLEMVLEKTAGISKFVLDEAALSLKPRERHFWVRMTKIWQRLVTFVKGT